MTAFVERKARKICRQQQQRRWPNKSVSLQKCQENLAPGYHFRPPLLLRLLSLVFTQKKEQRILNYFVAERTVVVGTDPSRHFSSERSSKGRRRPSLSTFPTTIIKNPQLSAGSESEQTYVRTLISRKNLKVNQTLDIVGKSAIKTSTNEKHLKAKSGDWFDEKMAKSFKGHFAALLMMQSLVLIQSSLVQIDSDRLYQRLTVQVTDQVPRHLCQNTLIQLEVRSILILFRFFFSILIWRWW